MTDTYTQLARRRYYFVGSVFHGVGNNEVQSGLQQYLFTFVNICALEP